MDKLASHLAHHAPLFARCAEIIHCDSHSQDGTKAYVAAELSHSNLRQFDHPPGLYQSWNFALQQCTQPFIYISTVGDEIEPDGLQQLLDVATQTNSDVVISPPRFVEESGRVNDALLWPINHLILNHRIETAGLVSTDQIFAEAVLNTPDGIMGSAASCLYRTSFLKPRPFPLGFHGACDSAWALENLPFARSAILPTPISTFLLHPKSYESHGLLNAEIAILIREHVQDILTRLIAQPNRSSITPSLLKPLLTFNEAFLDLARKNSALIGLRKKLRFLWPLSPRVWTIRRQRNQLRNLTRQRTTLIRKEMLGLKS